MNEKIKFNIKSSPELKKEEAVKPPVQPPAKPAVSFAFNKTENNSVHELEKTVESKLDESVNSPLHDEEPVIEQLSTLSALFNDTKVPGYLSDINSVSGLTLDQLCEKLIEGAHSDINSIFNELHGIVLSKEVPLKDESIGFYLFIEKYNNELKYLIKKTNINGFKLSNFLINIIKNKRFDIEMSHLKGSYVAFFLESFFDDKALLNACHQHIFKVNQYIDEQEVKKEIHDQLMAIKLDASDFNQEKVHDFLVNQMIPVLYRKKKTQGIISPNFDESMAIVKALFVTKDDFGIEDRFSKLVSLMSSSGYYSESAYKSLTFIVDKIEKSNASDEVITSSFVSAFKYIEEDEVGVNSDNIAKISGNIEDNFIELSNGIGIQKLGEVPIVIFPGFKHFNQISINKGGERKAPNKALETHYLTHFLS